MKQKFLLLKMGILLFLTVKFLCCSALACVMERSAACSVKNGKMLEAVLNLHIFLWYHWGNYSYIVEWAQYTRAKIRIADFVITILHNAYIANRISIMSFSFVNSLNLCSLQM